MSVIPVELINRCPGFAGRLTQFIIKTAIYKQPQLALAAALAATGSLKAGKVESATGLRTNHLIVGLGAASSGKGHALKITDRIFHEIGCDRMISGRPASDTGLLASLVRGDGNKLILWDEIGLALKKITSPKAPAYKAGILEIIMQLFSSADGFFRGDEYTNADNKRPRIDIQEPCLNLYGVSTPIRFYEALNSDFGSDGFLSRLLIFDSGSKHPEPTNTEGSSLPEALLESAKFIVNEKLPEVEGALDKPRPRKIPFSPGATVSVYNLRYTYNDLKQAEKSEVFQSIYGRSFEHIIKIALTVEPNDEISYDTLSWASEIYKHLLDTILKIMNQSVANSEYERNLIKVRNLFKEEKEITGTEFCRKAQWLNKRERNDILDVLAESGEIEYVKTYERGKKKNVTLIKYLK